MIRLLKISGFTLMMIVGVFLFNYLFLERLIIPDPCYYHSHETTMLFDLFYELTASEGYHPTPTIFNLILTLIIGTVAGVFLGLKLSDRKPK